MKERGILFSAPMVRALLAGAKTQTRRPLKLPPAVVKRGIHPRMDEWMPNRYTKGSGQYAGGNPDFTGDQPPGLLVTCLDGTCQRVPCPYGVPGDRLWVRETWRADKTWDGVGPMIIPRGSSIWFAAGGEKNVVGAADRPGKTRVSIFMPRWASRITLEVTEVRVQRLRSISAEDVIAEGIDPEPHLCGCEPCSQTSQICPATSSSLVLAYADLWRHINGPESWDRNEWVWAISFKRVDR